MNIEKLAQLLTQQGLTLSSVESCTGGGIAELCTSLAGSSDWFMGGLVTYSNEMKMRLGVPSNLISDRGAVSIEVAESMAISGCEYCDSDWSVSVSGIAGPGGGTEKKPVGTVCFGWANRKKVWSEQVHFDGDRQQVREASVVYSLSKLMKFIEA